MDGLEEGVFTRHIIESIYGWKEGTIKLLGVTDSRSLELAAHNSGTIADRKMRIDVSALRQSLARQEYYMVWRSGGEMLADVFTKKGLRTDQVVDTVRRGQLPAELCNL